MLEIETHRLLLRQYSLNDLAELTEILSDPEVMRYSPRGAIPKDRVKQSTKEILEFFIDHWRQHSFGVWAVFDKETTKLMGYCGLNFLPNSPEVEVLYRFAQTYWHQGIATEATIASIRYGFEEVQLAQIVGITLPEHTASRRVMEKAGLKYEKDARFYNLDVVYYALAKADYQRDESLYILRK